MPVKLPPFLQGYNLVALDFESFYDSKEYSLRRQDMSTSLYVRDERFKTHTVAIRQGRQRRARWYKGGAIERELDRIDWSNSILLAHHCMPGDVEVLTPEGWVRLADAPDTATVMQWDPVTESLSWATGAPKTTRHADSLLKWSTSFHKCAYTPEHRMYFHTPDKAEWRTQTAKEVAGKSPNNTYIPLSGVYTEHKAPIELKIDEAAFMEAVRADGSWSLVGGSCYGVRFKLKKQRKIDRLHDLIERLKLPYTEDSSGDTIHIVVRQCNLIQRLFSLLTSAKQYGHWILKLSVEARETILTEARFWDGSTKPNGSGYVWSCANPTTVEAFQLLAHTTGWSISGAWKNNERGHTKDVPGAKLYVATVRHKARTKLVTEAAKVEHNAEVYCYTVPTGAFLIRSNDRVLITGNCPFDGLILSHHYGHVPAFYADTLSMARALHGNHIDNALDTVAQYYGRGAKTPDVLSKLDGIRDPSKELLAELGYYNANDVDIMWDVFADMLEAGYPEDELRLIDMTVSLFTEPVLEVDRDLAEAERVKWKERKEALLTEVIQYDEDALAAVNTIMETAKERIAAGKRPRVSYNEHLGYEELISKTVKSNERYAEMLRKMGVSPPTKPSPSDPTQRIYAFARDDLDFQALQAHPDEQVRKLVDARLVAQSNINETRAEGLLARSHEGMKLPVYLNYCGAHTMRWCMPGDTEVLTPSGWVRMDTWNDEKIAEWSPDRRMKWHRPAMNRFPYKGDLVVADSMHVKGAFTPEHTIPRWTTKGTFTSNTAVELQNTNVRIPTPGVLSGGVGGSTVLTQLLVAVAADATIENSANRPLVFKFRKQRKIDRLKALLTEAEIPFKQYQCVRETQINISRRDVPPVLWEAKDLEVSDVLSWTEHRRQIFIAELHHWDGHFGSDAIHFTTTQPRWVELITAVAASIGMTSNVYTVERKHPQNTKYEVTLRAPSYVGVPSAGWRQESYEGDVYCPTTSTGYFVVRSRGKVFVTGNSGGDKLNPQNFPDPAKGTDSRLRECLVAPRGMRIVVVDSAQIEARVIAWLCGQMDKLEAFADPERDIYCEFGSKLYKYPVTKKDNPTERFVAKVCVLGLGFGMGPPKLQYTLATGAMGPPILLDIETCEAAVNLFRQENNRIQLGWRQLQQLISSCLIRGHEMTWANLIPMERERALMPNGLDLMYPNIRAVPKDDDSGRVEYRYKQRRNKESKIYGGLLSENFTQCIARIVIGRQALPVIERYRMLSLSHDELIYLAPASKADDALEFGLECLRAQPADWAEGLPLDSEGAHNRVYVKP